MKKKLAFEFDQMERERKEKEFKEMEKEKKRLQNARKSIPRRIKDALKSAFVDKPTKVAHRTFDVLTSKHAMELLLKSAIAFFAFDGVKTVRSQHRERVRRHRFGRDDKPVLVIKTSNRSFFGAAKTKAS